MNIRSKKLWAGTLAATGVAATSLALVTASAPADSERGVSTISMEQDGNQLFFSGPDTIFPGQPLRIQNNTSPQEFGPHTFTLVKKNLIPGNRDEFRACFRGEKNSVCDNIFKAHEVDFENEKVGKRNVDDGKDGWNLLFRKQGKKGDSWFTDEEGEQTTRVVSANAGKTLSYFCVIHPEMRGEIEVSNPVK